MRMPNGRSEPSGGQAIYLDATLQAFQLLVGCPHNTQ